ncbi:hypothetical protein LUQ84_002128 [Hamiltosporidium tvaerminnensis]|nr:hypothetical protein LUQ84_002128 [Hamiltosporidium tvaerminnensis]
MDPKITFEAAITDTKSTIYRTVMNLLLQGFSCLIGNLICFFPNFEDLYRFLYDNDKDKLQYEIDLFSNTLTFCPLKSKYRMKSYDDLPFQKLNSKVIKNSEYLKNWTFYKKINKFSDICPEEILEMPLNRFFWLGNQNITNVWNETGRKVNPDSSKCPIKGIFRSDLADINQIEDADNIEKLKKK